MISRPPAARRKTVLHLAYWVIVTLAFLFERSYIWRKHNLPYFVECVTVRMGLLVAVSYANSYWLLGTYLLKRKYKTYFMLVVLLIIAYVLIQSVYDLYLFGYVMGAVNDPGLWRALLFNAFNTVWYVTLSIALKLSIDWYEQNRVLQRTRIEKMQAEINYLRAQVNPHFLFNVLNSLYSLTIKKSDLAPEMVLKLSEMMEYMLYESQEPFVAMERELHYLRNYLDLEKLRQGNQADIRLEISGDPLGKHIAPFLLLPLVENAFKHGVSKVLYAAWLHIRVDIGADTLSFSIENNAPPVAAQVKHAGIGLSNLAQRLALLYPGRHTLEVNHEEEVFKLRMVIRLDDVAP
ncbi:histidine kinase [Pedobacter sp. HMF7056]|uniref:Histidine kinase n=2 Tax=Hufsiella ginkgonis TaxID=2695274 RepID=A0A7K1XU97_9SPHI|nr:histidine kinase [Hufsiella ginkgonis]